MTLRVAMLVPSEEPGIPASDFATWIADMDRVLRGGGESHVPCGSCTACCRGAYFITLRPEEAAARARIPAELLFPAPGAPAGHSLLGYDEAGRCPMLVENACSIYNHRPATCRRYDCRIFAATGLAEPEAGKASIMERAARWRFSYAREEDRILHRRLKAGVRFLLDAPGLSDLLPGSVTQLAMLAVRLHPLFAGLGDALQEGPESPGGRDAARRLRAAVEVILEES